MVTMMPKWFLFNVEGYMIKKIGFSNKKAKIDSIIGFPARIKILKVIVFKSEC